MLGKYSKLEVEHLESERMRAEQKRLIEQLEADLEKVNAVRTSDAESLPPSTPGDSTAGLAQARVLESLVGTGTGRSGGMGVAKGAQSAHPGGGNDLLPIIQSQRDRFRLRVGELEAVSTARISALIAYISW